ncbi:MAG: lipopolysaccharide heptosyltransferase I [Burkholderiales bacterium]|nr:lipopolysaccharide heptosyltransferase I [Burkholderiales bacterium]
MTATGKTAAPVILKRSRPNGNPRVLLVKTSSLGDVIHNLPVASDVRHHFPNADIHWLVEEQYTPIVEMHGEVDRIIAIALRRWRKAPWSVNNWRQFLAARRALRQFRYNAIIDTQGLLKSALFARLSKGPIHGFAARTAREPLASRFYDARYEFPSEMHKIERYRSVAARAFSYDLDNFIEYGIAPRVPNPNLIEGPYCVLLHSTARSAKLWGEDQWLNLIERLNAAGLGCILPWGNDTELRRSDRLAVRAGRTLVAPKLSLDQLSALIAGAELVVGVDTGLMHLAAAFSRPVVGIFCDSNPIDANPQGPGPTAYRGDLGKPPSVDDVVSAIREVKPGTL